MGIQLSSLSPLRLFGRKPVAASNRRNARRVRASNLLKCLRSDDAPEEMLTNVTNISETGLRFSSASGIKPESVLNLVINFPEMEKQVPVVARVAWQGQVRGHGLAYRIGGEFLNIALENRQLIRDFVKKVAVLSN